MTDKRIKLNGPSEVELFLRSIIEASVDTARSYDDDSGLAGTSQRERSKQNAVAQSIKQAVGGMSDKKKKDAGDVEEDEDDESLFGDEKKDDDEKKKSSDDGDKKPDDENKRKGRLPKHMHHDLPAAEDVSLEMIVDRLNVVRSGKSLKDEKVAVEMLHYFEGLSSPERLALLSFLTGLAEIVTAGVEGENAPDPGDPGVDVSVIASKQKKKEKASADKKRVKKSQPAQAQGGEDVTPPIQVGGPQATESIRRKIRSLL